MTDEALTGVRDDVLAAISRFETHLGSAAPEVIPLRVTELREAVRYTFEVADRSKAARLLVWAARDGISARIIIPAGGWAYRGDSLEVLDGATMIAEFDRSAVLGVSLAVDGVEEDLDGAEAFAASETLGIVADRLENLAADLEKSAQATAPSRKSDIESGCAGKVREIGRLARDAARDGR